jgi:hypothetical protein
MGSVKNLLGIEKSEAENQRERKHRKEHAQEEQSGGRILGESTTDNLARNKQTLGMTIDLGGIFICVLVVARCQRDGQSVIGESGGSKVDLAKNQEKEY